YRCQRPSEAPKIEGSHSRLVNSHLADTGGGRACLHHAMEGVCPNATRALHRSSGAFSVPLAQYPASVPFAFAGSSIVRKPPRRSVDFGTACVARFLHGRQFLRTRNTLRNGRLHTCRNLGSQYAKAESSRSQHLRSLLAGTQSTLPWQFRHNFWHCHVAYGVVAISSRGSDLLALYRADHCRRRSLSGGEVRRRV